MANAAEFEILPRSAIDEEDYDLIYILLAQRVRLSLNTYDSAWLRLELAPLTNDHCSDRSRFEYEGIVRLWELLRPPEEIRAPNGVVC